MKLQRIARICKRARNITIVKHIDQSGEVKCYIGVGAALYAVPGLSDQTPDETLFTVFDIAKEDQPKYKIDRIDELKNDWFDTFTETEHGAVDSGISVVYRGVAAVPFYTERGSVLLIVPIYLGPFADEIRDTASGLMFVAKEGLNGIAVRRGLFDIIAVIAAMEPREAFSNALIELGKTIERKGMLEETQTFRSVMNQEGER